MFSVKNSSGLPIYKRLADVTLPEEGIDEKIRDLVRALRVIRVKTNASCEGHLNRNCHQHPWVGFNPFSFAKIRALEYLVEKYNKTHKIRWQVDGSWLRPITFNEFCQSCSGIGRMLTEQELVRLQQSAASLARYIFSHRTQRAIRDLILIHGL